MRGLRTTTAVLMGLASACAGTSTGNPFDPPGPDGEEVGSNRCDSKAEPLAGLDAESPLGFSAAEMLALTTGHGQVPIAWSPSTSGLSFGPESGTGTLAIEVSARNDTPRFVDQSPRASSDGRETLADEVEVQCPDLVELDVRVRFQTSGGAFDEQFDAVLRATSASVARIYTQLEAAELQGSFEASLNQPAMAELDDVLLDLGFSSFGAGGSLGLAFSNSEVATATPAIARWPADLACRESRFGTALDRRVGEVSVAAGIEAFNAASLQLTAAGAAATPLELRFTPTATSACVVDLEEAGGPALEVDGTLSIRTGDDRIAGEWPVGLRVETGEGGALGAVRVAFDLRGSIIASLVDAARFESTYGVHGLDVSGYGQAGIVLTLAVGPGAAASGEIVVNGATMPDCAAPPPPPPSGSSSGGASSPGCAGTTFTPVWTATIGAR